MLAVLVIKRLNFNESAQSVGNVYDAAVQVVVALINNYMRRELSNLIHKSGESGRGKVSSVVAR